MKRFSLGFALWCGFTLCVCAFLVVPIVLSIMAGLTFNIFQGITSGLTLTWVFKVWDLYRDTIWLSLLIAVCCLGCDLVVGVPAAYVLVKAQSRTARLLEELLAVPIAVPGLALALALIQTYGAFGGFRKSWTFILAGHVLFTLPFMIRSVIAVLSSIDLQALEEGAASLGASFWQRLWGVVLPNAMSGIVAGALMVFTLSVGEFNLTWMLHTPLTKTLPVGLADSYASMRLEIGSAYTLLFFIMIVPMLLFMQWYGRPRTQRVAAAPVTEL